METKTRQLKLTNEFMLFGFDSEEEMQKWIREFNSMDGEDVPPPFSECSAYSGLTSDCEPKEEWVERDGKMDTPNRFWYKPYDGSKYCKNHYKWSFETAVTALGNPTYIIVLKTK